MQQVFVSYSHKDNDFAQLLRTELLNAGITCWLAQENLKAGEDWKEGIDEAIKKSFALIVIISPASDQSKYVTYEWALAYGLGISIIPVMYKKIDVGQKLHPRLESLQYEDFTSNINRPWQRIVARLHEVFNESNRKDTLDAKILEAIQALRSWDTETITKAAEMLGRRKIQSAVPDLEKLLDEPDQDIQIAALNALGNIGYSQAIEKIIDLVGARNETRFAAIDALGKLGDLRAEEILLQQMISEDYRTKIISINALTNLSVSSPVFKDNLFDLLQSFTFEPEDIVWSEWDGDAVLSSVFNALSNLVSKDDAQRLVGALDKENPSVVVGIIRLLGELQDKTSFPVILKLTRNVSSKVSNAAISVLEASEPVANFQSIRDNLSGDQEENAQDAIQFFFKNFGLEGLLYLLSYQQSKYYWQVSKKIEEIAEVSDFNRLIESLQDPVDRVRGLVADILRNKKITQSCENLRVLIDDKSPFVRGLAIRAVGELGCDKSIRLLKSKLKDTNRIFSNSTNEVRDFAAISLARMKNKDSLPRIQELIFDDALGLREEAMNSLIGMKDSVDIKHFEGVLLDGNLEQRVSALKILALLEKDVDLIIIQEEINSDEVEVRKAALEVLSNLYPPHGLILSLTFRNIKSYWEIAEEIKKSLRVENAPFVVKFLSGEHYRIRAFLSYAIGLRPDLSFGEYLVPLINDGVSFVRGLAIQSLGLLRYKPASELLLSRLTDNEKIYANSDARVCDYAAAAIVEIENKVTTVLLDSFKSNDFDLMSKIIDVSKTRKVDVEREFILELLEILKNNDEKHLHISCLRLIGEFGLPEDASVLLRYLSQSDGENWSAVEGAVIKIADSTIVSDILNYLSYDNDYLLMACLDILEIHGSRSVLTKVLDLVNRNNLNPYVLFRSINVLSAYGDTSFLDAISKFSKSSEDSVRCSVVTAYGKLKREDNFTKIISFLDDPSYVVRAAAVKALIALKQPDALEIVLKKMDVWGDSNNDYFKYEYDIACLELIGLFGNEEHLPMLREIALRHDNDDCRAASLRALAALGDNNLVEISIKLLDDDGYSYENDMPVSHLAARVLYGIDLEIAKTALEKWLSSLDEEERPILD